MDGESNGGGPTTLMLFNIFTPDEVDFLKQLVGDDVVEKLEEDEDEEEVEDFGREEENGREKEKPEEYVTRESLVSYEHSASVNWGRPSQTKDTPIVSKNALASSQGSVRPASNTRGSSGAQSGLAGEAFQPTVPTTVGTSKHTRTTTAKTLGKASSAGSKAWSERSKRKDERIKKMENLLGKLSERYKKRTEEPAQVQNMDEAMKEAEKTERMKIMIENLKSRLSKSRPGMNRLSLADLDEDMPFVTTTTRRPGPTEPPVPINSVESMIGEKIRGMRVGMNRLDLDEVLDLDSITVERNPVTNGDSEPADSFREYSTSVVGPDKKVPKRQAIHPRLKYHRPDSDDVHRPSINLKAAISPVTPEPYVGNGYSDRKVIGRYQELHGGKAHGKYHADSYMAEYNAADPPYKYPSYPESPHPPSPAVTKELPRLKKGERGDPYPETKELPPYHNPVSLPSHTTETAPGGPIFYTEGSSTDSSPPIFYPDRPNGFNPLGRPPPYAGNDRHVPRDAIV